MHVITRARIVAAQVRFPECAAALDCRYRLIKRGTVSGGKEILPDRISKREEILSRPILTIEAKSTGQVCEMGNGVGNETLETREFEFGSAARAVVSPGRSDPAFSPVTAVFLECRQHLRSFVARFLPRAYDIDDIVQEVFLRAYITERTQLVHAPKAFLFCIAKNLSLKEIARRVRHGPGGNTPPSVSEDLPEVASHEPPLEDQLEGQEKLVAFCRAVASLPPQCRHAFLMRKLYDLSYKEIADELGVTVRTVEKHVAAGLERCGTYLHRLGYELEGPIRAASGESPGKATRTR